MAPNAQRWHIRISDWMEQNGYPADNSEKTIFMKRQDSDFIIHGLFVDCMMHVPTRDKLRDEFLQLYQKDFEITGGGLMETFLGMEVEQPGKVIKLHLDSYIQEVLKDYKEYVKKSLRPKRVPMSPGLVLDNEDCPDPPDPRKQKFYRSFTAKSSVRGIMDSIRYCIYCIIVGSFLCIRRSIALGGTASFDGVPRRLSKLQAHLSPAHRDRRWIIWLRRFRLG
jgi:hypothetical protein